MEFLFFAKIVKKELTHIKNYDRVHTLKEQVEYPLSPKRDWAT